MTLLDLIRRYEAVKINGIKIPINKIICFDTHKHEGICIAYSTKESGKFEIKEIQCKPEDVILIKKEG